MLQKSDKEKIIGDIKARIDTSQAVFLTNVIGVTSNSTVELRKKLRDANGSLVVTRNTLFRIASKGTPCEDVLSGLKGPSAVAFATDDAPAVAKVLKDFSKESELVQLKAGVLEGKVLSKEDLVSLANLPSRDQMLATLLATFNAPVSAFVRVMDAIRDEKEKN
jgi:large subunit ribosomal protein L10